MIQNIQFMAGICFALMGLSFLIRAADWEVWLNDLNLRARQESLSLGLISIFLGSFVVAFHWVWEGVPAILTLVGVISLIKGTIYVLFPQWLVAKLHYFASHMKVLLRVAGLGWTFLGVLLIRESCSFLACLEAGI